MSVEATLRLNLDVIETLENNSEGALPANRKVTWNVFAVNKALNGSTSQPATQVSCDEKSFTTSGTIDLTALVGANAAAINGTGLKVQAVLIRAKANNTNPVAIDVGASNGYELLGADFHATLVAGQAIAIDLNDASPDIGSSSKILDVTCTGTQILQMTLLLG